jgi:hypothetical protein
MPARCYLTLRDQGSQSGRLPATSIPTQPHPRPRSPALQSQQARAFCATLPPWRQICVLKRRPAMHASVGPVPRDIVLGRRKGLEDSFDVTRRGPQRSKNKSRRRFRTPGGDEILVGEA